MVEFITSLMMDIEECPKLPYSGESLDLNKLLPEEVNMSRKKAKIISGDSIYYTYRDSKGMYSLREHEISPSSQEEADQIYNDLNGYLCDESLYEDGELSASEAKGKFIFYMAKARRVGYLPTEDGERWRAGDSPSSIKWGY